MLFNKRERGKGINLELKFQNAIKQYFSTLRLEKKHLNKHKKIQVNFLLILCFEQGKSQKCQITYI